MKIAEIPHFDYVRKGHIPTSKGWCNLRVYQHNGQTIVVASEVIRQDGSYANEGMSVINAVEMRRCASWRQATTSIFL